ncbi:ATP-dependent DNA helicase [Blastopirellula marina]|uniref:Possible Viral (Superfamily 1) RNA helicase n=1 Tax=Blastopirellula marina DSM 3645 TaxID=314230 RepID=A3ZSA6_9BACT|nr:AAA family ATPase [Blastopirellula marina]EAQ80564.1 possible Viral (Superfamily 1) RNA helicase [Blastopirellula marina DSM 3645]
MADLSYPMQHVSVRVPWHDNGWAGTICKEPKYNTSCLKLKGIADSKDEAAEEAIAATSILDLQKQGIQLPPCVKERATFMADFEFDRVVEHPYAKNNSKTHGHFRPTALRHPAYSAAAVPFLWMMRDQVFGNPKNKEIIPKVDRYPIDGVDLEFEPSEEELGFNTNWVQDRRNHLALLECFWKHVRPKDSLVFFYAKQVPLVEDVGRRVLIGVGRVKHLGKFTEYKYDGDPGDQLRSMLWECMVTHSIRPDCTDGFLLPYHEALIKSDEGRAFNPADAVAFSPDDRFNEFSYGTEHVSNDAAISALLSIRDALQRSSELFGYVSDAHEKWVDRELGRLWNKRGPFPGIGSVLTATGVTLGNFVAQALIDKVGEKDSPWPAWFAALEDPSSHLPAELARRIDKTIAKSWKRMGTGRRSFLELLSRLDLTQDQASVLVSPEEREDWEINCTDDDFVANPYLIYETTRLAADPVSIGIVDRGLFPNAMIRSKFPIPEPSIVKTAVDTRRLRALTIRNLEDAAQNGDTLRQRADVIRDLRRHAGDDDEQKAQVTADLMTVAEEELFKDEIRIVKMADDRAAYQLERLGAAGDLIRRTVENRIDGKRHESTTDWRKSLNSFLESNGVVLPGDVGEREIEELARKEKTAALEELASSRFSVLIGRAGTGKTTLLSVLCAQPRISKEGVLLLAPTGKARVRMEDVARKAGIKNSQAFTLAQHLSQSGRYDRNTQRYLLTGKRGDPLAKTVIVDECSMLTEEMMAALIESLIKVDRLIFVGDYRQLPPIGAGRPFIDIVTRLQPDVFPADEPHVAPGYTELMIPRRQGAGERDDLLLASWFGSGETSAGDDQVFEILSGKRKSETVEFVTWETPDELERKLPKVLRETLEFKAENEDWQAFSISLGGNPDDSGSIWFNGKWGKFDGAGVAAEAWQILSPVRQKPWGVETLNRLIHRYYKERTIEQARNFKGRRSIPSPMGEHQIVYGDKVINNRNQRMYKKRMYPTPDKDGYLANGEIGVVIGHRRTKKKSWDPKYLEIEFSTQQGTSFKFYPSDFKEEGEASLELAYALTVHKAQGSEFKKVFLVLPRSPLMVTRELLYTALTRQKEKVVVLLQGSATDLHRFSSERFSAAACRLTNLFGPPRPIEIKGAFLEERLIHNTTRGELVRSKSEVIIANLLHAKKIEYDYEVELTLDGEPQNKFPDFTIEDDDSGKKYYWEHLGMLGNQDYSRRWVEKEQWYRDHGILARTEGHGPNGTLITTQDDLKGGIDAMAINRMIEEIFGS